MTKFKLTIPARKSLKSIALYTLKNSGKNQMLKYITAFDSRFHYLAENPLHGKDRSYIVKGLRSYNESSHVIFNYIKKDHIEILDILHQNTEPEQHFDD